MKELMMIYYYANICLCVKINEFVIFSAEMRSFCQIYAFLNLNSITDFEVDSL